VHNNQLIAAAGPALTWAAQRLELVTPPGDALFGADTSGLAENYILYCGRQVLPIGGYLGNVRVPTLATLQADISRGYVRLFVLPVSPGPDPRVRWIESHCIRPPEPPRPRPVPYATFLCGSGVPQPAAGPQPAEQGPVPAPSAWSAVTGVKDRSRIEKHPRSAALSITTMDLSIHTTRSRPRGGRLSR